MANLLFDLPALTGTPAVSAEEVGRLNPQCGDMRHLDEVLWLDEPVERGVGIKRVRDDEFWVPGHIPGRPLLPGVLMIEAAAQLCSIMFRQKVHETKFLGFTRVDTVAFRGQVVPGDDLLLLAHEVELRPRRIVSDTQGLVGDSVVFEGRITGMVM